MNYTAVAITAIICLTVIILSAMDKGKQKDKQQPTEHEVAKCGIIPPQDVSIEPIMQTEKMIIKLDHKKGKD